MLVGVRFVDRNSGPRMFEAEFASLPRSGDRLVIDGLVRECVGHSRLNGFRPGMLVIAQEVVHVYDSRRRAFFPVVEVAGRVETKIVTNADYADVDSMLSTPEDPEAQRVD